MSVKSKAVFMPVQEESDHEEGEVVVFKDVQGPPHPSSSTSAGPGRSPTVGNHKLWAFLSLVIVQGGHVLFFKLSQQEGGGYKYNTASAIATTELIKFLISCALHFLSEHQGGVLADFYLVTPRQVIAWAVLAILYCINNQLTFWLLVLMGPGQLSLGKSITPMLTAMMLWALFGEEVTRLQWVCIVLSVAGLMCVLQPRNPTVTETDDSVDHEVDESSALGGVLLLISCLITAVTSVVNAKMVQAGKVPLNVQNMLLYSQGFIANIVAYWLMLVPSPSGGYFAGYGDIMVIMVLLSQSLIGIAITLVYKYGGAIVKTLAVAAQAAILSVLDSVMFGVPWNSTTVAGNCVQSISLYLFIFLITFELIYIYIYIYFMFGIWIQPLEGIFLFFF
jgi:drug/metabolite transporter (DMT)-like permease